MGTAIGVDLWADDAAVGAAALDAVMAEMHRIDRRMSPHKPDSELSRINACAGHQAVPVSGEMFALLARAVGFSRLSGGAFDITFASVGNLFDYRHGIRPTDAEIDLARRAIGWQHLLLDARDRTVRFAQPGMRIDLGGFAKGHAVDNATALLRGLGIRHAIVSAGGDSRVIGDRRGQPWTVAIRHPRKPDDIVAVMPLVECAISTSGDYERGFDEGGVRWHHIVDPATGRSPDRVHSVTILANDGLTAEALSKTVFVQGVERGLSIVESIPGTDAVVVDAHGVLHVSSGLQDSLPPSARTTRQ
jgi:FAD:protein FMN transferase